jgi:formylglycine-generating enzyme required for sulfatase activity
MTNLVNHVQNNFTKPNYLMKPKHPTHLITLILCLMYAATQAQEICGNEDFVRLHKLGLAQYAKKQYAKAIESLELANRYCPKCPDCKAKVAVCRVALKNQQIMQENAELKRQLAETNKKPKPPKPVVTPSPKTDPFAGQMVLVQGGSFMMGSNKGDANASDDEMVNGEKHQVTVAGFWIGRTEVTQAQWRAVMGKNPARLYNKNCDKCPVDRVSWDDTQQFLKKLNARTGKTYRLPTEAEWEYAARAGDGTNWTDNYLYAGSNDIRNVAWYGGNYRNSKHGEQGTTHPVATKAANTLGLYDMTGNVWEWCADWYKGYPGSTGVSDYTNSYRVLRGGSWYHNPQFSRVAYRNYLIPKPMNADVGLRLALSQ